MDFIVDALAFKLQSKSNFVAAKHENAAAKE
jgi:hypothetical protein